MSDLIPRITKNDFDLLTSDQVRQLKSCEIYGADDVKIGTIIISPLNGGMSVTDNINTQAEYLALRSNSVGGKSLEEVKDI